MSTPRAAPDTPDNTHPTWYKDKGLRKNVYHCMGLCLCVFYLGYDQSLLACLQSIPQVNPAAGCPPPAALTAVGRLL